MIEARVPQYAAESSALQFPLERNRELYLPVRVLQPDVAPSLARHLPAGTVKRTHELRPRNDGRAGRHAEMGNVRRRTGQIKRPNAPRSLGRC